MTKIRGVRHAVLGVRDPERSISFYRDTLGMEVVLYLEDMQMAFFSFGEHDHDLAVVKVPDDDPVGSPGIAHTALEIDGGEDQLRELYTRLKERGIEVEMTADHVVTKSFYFKDPDGNRLEFYTQVLPSSEGKKYMQSVQGAEGVLKPLDLEEAVAS
jgi:catechol 2,3-dioxygenase